MKKLIVLILFVLGVTDAYPQDLIGTIQKLTIEKDSLQRQVIKPLNDSIVKLTATHIIELAKLSQQIKALENENNELNKKNKNIESALSELNKNKVKVERDSFKVICDSLTRNIKEKESYITEKQKQLQQEREIGKQNAIQEKEKGKVEIQNNIVQKYNKPLDELIVTTTLKSLERDISIIGDKTIVQQKILSLQTYFNSEKSLNEKYNQEKVDNAINQLKSLEQTENVLKNIDKLSKYKLCNDGLKTTIDKIVENDKIVATTEDTQKDKLKDILVDIAWYIRNYRFNFNDYPYLSEIVLEIIKSKQKDANTDISLLKEKL